MASSAGVIARAAFGVGAGVLTVAGGCSAVASTGDVPKFSMSGERFDQSSFLGRWKKMMMNVDPATLAASDGDVRAAVALLESFEKVTEENAQDNFDNAALWRARQLKESAVHPDTGELVPRPFRMAGYVPFNGPVCVAMMASTSTPALLFWNWANQSQNALVNYFNRNASSPMSNETMLKSYSGAVLCAMGVAFGLSQAIKRTCSPSKATKLLKFVAFPSSVIASSSNCYIVRRPEIAAGVELVDADGNTVANGARSSIAARKAVHETVISRAMLQVPVFFVPAALVSLPPVAAALAGSAGTAMAVTSFITCVSFGFGLPATIAWFPQIGQVNKSDLEPSFADVPCEKLYYNKGL